MDKLENVGDYYLTVGTEGTSLDDNQNTVNIKTNSNVVQKKCSFKNIFAGPTDVAIDPDPTQYTALFLKTWAKNKLGITTLNNVNKYGLSKTFLRKIGGKKKRKSRKRKYTKRSLKNRKKKSRKITKKTKKNMNGGSNQAVLNDYFGENTKITEQYILEYKGKISELIEELNTLSQSKIRTKVLGRCGELWFYTLPKTTIELLNSILIKCSYSNYTI
jgi:hypothetical protein